MAASLQGIGKAYFRLSPLIFLPLRQYQVLLFCDCQCMSTICYCAHFTWARSYVGSRQRSRWELTYYAMYICPWIIDSFDMFSWYILRFLFCFLGDQLFNLFHKPLMTSHALSLLNALALHSKLHFYFILFFYLPGKWSLIIMTILYKVDDEIKDFLIWFWHLRKKMWWNFVSLIFCYYMWCPIK